MATRSWAFSEVGAAALGMVLAESVLPGRLRVFVELSTVPVEVWARGIDDREAAFRSGVGGSLGVVVFADDAGVQAVGRTS